MTDTLEVPQEYVDKSKKITKLYDDFLTVGESLDQLVTELRDILVNAGFSKTQAMMKIAEDHKHLRRFSLTNIYRMLPKEEKRDYTDNSQTLKVSNITNLENNVTTPIKEKKEYHQPSSALEEFRQEHGQQQEQEHDLPEPRQELPDDDFDQSQDIIYDKDLVDRYVKEINRLEEENAQLKINRIPTRSNKFDFRYEIEFNDEMLQLIKANSGICPFIGTAFPDKGDGYIRFDKEKIQRSIKEAQKKR